MKSNFYALVLIWTWTQLTWSGGRKLKTLASSAQAQLILIQVQLNLGREEALQTNQEQSVGVYFQQQKSCVQ